MGFYWSLIEAGIAIIVACLPTINTLIPRDSIRPLFQRIRSLPTSLLTLWPYRSARESELASFTRIGTDGSRSRPSRPHTARSVTQDHEMLPTVHSSPEGVVPQQLDVPLRVVKAGSSPAVQYPEEGAERTTAPYRTGTHHQEGWV